MAGLNIPSGAYKINGVDVTSTLKLKQSTGLTYNPANPFVFDKEYQYNNYTLTSNITPTYSLTNAVPLTFTQITFIGDGIHTVDFSNFTESDLSGTFDTTLGVENKVVFYYDGYDILYSVISAARIATSSITGLLSSTDWTTFNSKQAALVSGTNIKTINSTSLLGSGDIAVQPTLVSGTNIKTINGTSVLGSGDLTISTGVTPTDNIFDWDVANNWYAPYSSKQAGMSFYTGTTNTTLTDRLNLDASLYTTTLNSRSSASTVITGNSIGGVSAGLFQRSANTTTNSPVFQISESNFSSTTSYPSALLYITRQLAGTANVTGNIIDINDDPTTSGTTTYKVLSATIGTTERISLNPRFISGTVGDAYMFDTHTSISSTNSYLFNFKNNGNTAFGYKLYGSANYLFIDGQPFIGNNGSGIAYSNIRWGLSGALCSGNSSTTNPHAFYHTTASGDNNINSFLIHRNHGGAGASTGNILQIQDDNSTSGTISGALINGTVLGTPRFIVNPRVADGASAVAYLFDTHNNLTINGSKIFQFSNQGVEKVYFSNHGNIARTVGTSSTFATVGGVLKDFYTDAATSGTSLTTLYTYDIPANTLVNDGDKIIFEVVATTVGSYHIDSSVTFSFGTTLGGAGYSEMNSGQPIKCTLVIIRTSSSTCRVYSTYMGGNNNYTGYEALSSKNWTISNTLSFIALAGTGTIIARTGYIEYKPAAIN